MLDKKVDIWFVLNEVEAVDFGGNVCRVDSFFIENIHIWWRSAISFKRSRVW